MTTKLSNLFYTFLNIAASTQKLGINLIRTAILIIFVWIGGLKFYNYEAEGIVPFVANSPFMSFFYTKNAPKYKETRSHTDNFGENNVKCLIAKGICRFVPHSSAGGF